NSRSPLLSPTRRSSDLGLEFGKTGQIVRHPVYAEIAHELAGGGIGESPAHGVGAAVHVHELFFQQAFHAPVHIHAANGLDLGLRSEEHTSELQSREKLV